MATTAQNDGLVDLEKELSCSICTDVLYQPLTLLDCLHTFCGSCLREWFSWQASNATSGKPYTCPSCRATVRETRPNATVTTLLDMFLRTHPDKIKSEEDQREIAKVYKPGDNVIPPVHVNVDSDESENERMLAEARELSLHDMDPERVRRRAERAERHARHRRQREGTARTDYLHDRSAELDRSHRPSNSHTQHHRQVEHQASLRSLLNASDIDSHEMEEEIMHQIMDEGLLEGIDLNSLTPSQEEEITERIAQAFRRRQQQRSSQTDTRSSSDRSHRSSAQLTPPRHQRQVSSDSSRQSQTRDRPPASSSSLLEVQRDDRDQRARSTSQSSQRSNRGARGSERSAAPSSAWYAASRSTTDLSEQPRTDDHQRPPRMSANERTTTDPEGHAASVRTLRERAASNDQRAHQGRERSVPTASRVSTQVPQLADPLRTLRSQNRPTNNSSPALPTSSMARQDLIRDQRPATSSGANLAAPQSIAATALACPKPSITCSRCERPDIQYTLHYNCPKCSAGEYNLCLTCYRAGKGCLHWFGFGYAAIVRYQRAIANPECNMETGPPHILNARRHRPRTPNLDPKPQHRLEEGVFCESCLTIANECYWHCDICNNGAWGYCDHCLQQGKHCTHPLESLAHVSTGKTAKSMYLLGQQDQELYPAPLSPKMNTSLSMKQPPQAHPLAVTNLPNVPDPQSYKSITLASYCDICQRSIPPSHTRFHCNTCNAGNYDICTPCYHNLVSSGQITPDNGPQGWRRCFRGHRMAVVGYEDREGGQHRVVVREMVGGWALKEDEQQTSQTTTGATKWSWRENDGSSATAESQLSHMQRSVLTGAKEDQSQRSLLPPDGGVGLRVLALWSYFPAEGVQNELAFPKNAEVREVEDVNGDWFWGVYAGQKGLFSGNYGRIL